MGDRTTIAYIIVRDQADDDDSLLEHDGAIITWLFELFRSPIMNIRLLGGADTITIFLVCAPMVEQSTSIAYVINIELLM